MCDIKCNVNTTTKHSFEVGGLRIEISQGAYNNASITRTTYPFIAYQHVSFDSLKDFKKFCEQTMKCLNRIENES